jgi:hypothetical protein
MRDSIHPQARTTPLVRREIQSSSQSQQDLVETYGASCHTTETAKCPV